MDNTYYVGSATADSIEMKYMKFGYGARNLVVIPGVSLKSVLESAASIALSFSDFCEEYTVFLFDRRDNIKTGYLESEMADDTVKIMKALDISNAYIYGVSQGGIIAQFIGVRHPDIVKCMFLASTTSKVDDNVRGVVAKWINLAEKKDSEKLVTEFARTIYSKETLQKMGDAVKFLVRDVSDEDYARFIVQCEAVLKEETYNDLAMIKCPVAVVGAYNDKVFGADGARCIAEAIGVTPYIFEKYGHAVYDETPDVLRIMREFFIDK